MNYDLKYKKSLFDQIDFKLLYNNSNCVSVMFRDHNTLLVIVYFKRNCVYLSNLFKYAKIILTMITKVKKVGVKV